MVAAVSLASPWFNLLTALGNLFGLGGGSLISRMLGKQNHKDIRNVSAFSVCCGAWRSSHHAKSLAWTPPAK